jgi:hypothetical protein
VCRLPLLYVTVKIWSSRERRYRADPAQIQAILRHGSIDAPVRGSVLLERRHRIECVKGTAGWTPVLRVRSCWRSAAG